MAGRKVALPLHVGSMLIWALFPAWSAVLGLGINPWLSGGMLLLLSGAVQVAIVILCCPQMFPVYSEPGIRQAARKRKWPLASIFGVTAEDVGFLQSLRYMDPAASNCLTRLYVVISAACLNRTANGRYHINRRALIGLAVGSTGASSVIWSAAGGSLHVGSNLIIGTCLASLALLGLVANNTQELAFVADVSASIGWQGVPAKRREELALGAATIGLRNLVAGALLTLVAIFVGGGMSPRAWGGTVVFAALLAPAGVTMARAATLIDGNLGLWAVHSAGALAAVGWTWLVLGEFAVGKTWLLVSGAALISVGTAIATVRPSTSRKSPR